MSPAETLEHRPVMPGEVVRILVEGGVDLLLDATVGAGGHAERFLSARGESGRVVGLDRDPSMIERARERLARFGHRVHLAARSYAELDGVLDGLGIDRIDGALFDLGASSVHFDDPARGFSFAAPGPLDMRYDPREGPTAAEIVNRTPEGELADLLFHLGGETRSRAVARAIVRERPIRDTLRLAEIVAGAVGGARGRIHPATRTFMALRIAVNREHEHLDRGLAAALARLRPGGRLVVLSFHSGEDGRVKRFLREAARRGEARLLTPKPLRPGSGEARENRRARSARLRAAERTAGEGRE